MTHSQDLTVHFLSVFLIKAAFSSFFFVLLSNQNSQQGPRRKCQFALARSIRQIHSTVTPPHATDCPVMGGSPNSYFVSPTL